MPTDVEVVLANNAAFNRRDIEAMLECYADDALVTDHRHLGGMGDHRGHGALRAYYGSIFDNTTDIREDMKVLGAGEDVVATHCRTIAHLPSEIGSESIELTYGMVLWMRDGRIQTLEVYEDGDAALAAAGLSAATPPASA
jgi:ketosteroid isomerase-like protein